MTKAKFYEVSPKTRAEFIAKYNADFRFRNEAKVQGFSVVGECVIFPNGKVANTRVK